MHLRIAEKPTTLFGNLPLEQRNHPRSTNCLRLWRPVPGLCDQLTIEEILRIPREFRSRTKGEGQHRHHKLDLRRSPEVDAGSAKSQLNILVVAVAAPAAPIAAAGVLIAGGMYLLLSAQLLHFPEDLAAQPAPHHAEHWAVL